MQSAVRQIITFYVGGLYLAIDVAFMHDVLGKKEYSPAPLAVFGIRGLINLRGNIVTVLDIENIIKAIYQAQDRPYNIVFELNSEFYGLAVDKIGEFMTIVPDEIKSTPNSINPAVAQISSGVVYINNEIIVLLEPEQIIKFLLESSETSKQ